MKLTLDYTQRLNLHALLGAQRTDVGSIRAIWAIQDRLALDADEENAVELKREMVAGQERVVWNLALSIPAKEFEFSDPEAARLKAAIQTWDWYGANADRRWLQPLVETLFSTEPRAIGGNMKALLLIAKYLPVVMGTVAAVEQTVQAPGQTKRRSP